MRAVYDQIGDEASPFQQSLRRGYRSGIVIGAGLSSAEDQMGSRIARRLDDRHEAIVVDAEEYVLRHGCHDTVDGDVNVPARAVLESHRHAQAACHEPVRLTLRRPCADRSPGNEVAEVLGRERLKELRRRRQSQAADLDEKLPRPCHASLHVVAPIQVGVVDEALPADGRARLLEVDPHGDHDPALDLRGQGRQSPGVVEAHLRIVDRARAHDHQHPPGPAAEYLLDLASVPLDLTLYGVRQWISPPVLGGRGEARYALDPDIVCRRPFKLDHLFHLCSRILDRSARLAYPGLDAGREDLGSAPPLRPNGNSTLGHDPAYPCTRSTVNLKQTRYRPGLAQHSGLRLGDA